MTYKTIFGTKPKKENKIEFCRRIVCLLNDIRFSSDGYNYNDSERMINNMFKYRDLNNGYLDINDLLNEADVPYATIFDIVKFEKENISEEEILVNIDLIINCLVGFKKIVIGILHMNQAR